MITVTGTMPGTTVAGAITRMEPALFARNSAAGMAPNSTPVTSARLEPVMVNCVPPLTVPKAGKTLVTEGGVVGM